jgi:site-specific recombinase XerD
MNPIIRQSSQLAQNNPALVYLASLSVGSHPAMINALGTIATIISNGQTDDYTRIPWHKMRFQHTSAIRARLAERYNYQTANKMLSALRGVLEMAWKLNYITDNEYHKAIAFDAVKGESVSKGRSIDTNEFVALLNTCDDAPMGIRDATIITLLYACGLRRAEIVELDITDYVENSLIVNGKRNKQRRVPLATGAQQALNEWIGVRSPVEPLFHGLGNRNKHKRLTTQFVYKMLNERAERAGLSHLSPHDMRRTFVGDLLDKGVDIVTVQKLAGHANVTTTARYDRRGEQTKRDAVELLDIPTRGETK